MIAKVKSKGKNKHSHFEVIVQDENSEIHNIWLNDDMEPSIRKNSIVVIRNAVLTKEGIIQGHVHDGFVDVVAEKPDTYLIELPDFAYDFVHFGEKKKLPDIFYENNTNSKNTVFSNQDTNPSQANLAISQMSNKSLHSFQIFSQFSDSGEMRNSLRNEESQFERNPFISFKSKPITSISALVPAYQPKGILRFRGVLHEIKQKTLRESLVLQCSVCKSFGNFAFHRNLCCQQPMEIVFFMEFYWLDISLMDVSDACGTVLCGNNNTWKNLFPNLELGNITLAHYEEFDKTFQECVRDLLNPNREYDILVTKLDKNVKFDGKLRFKLVDVVDSIFVDLEDDLLDWCLENYTKTSQV